MRFGRLQTGRIDPFAYVCGGFSLPGFSQQLFALGAVLQFPSLFSQPLSLLGQPLIVSFNTPMLAHSPSPQEATSQLDTYLVSGTVGYPTQRMIFFWSISSQPSGNEISGQASSLSLAGLGGGSFCQSQEARADVKIAARPPEKRH
jgi:hypothetical protein